MTVFVDTSVWSLAFRRDAPTDVPHVAELERALEAGGVFSTGIVLQELLQGFRKPKAHARIVELFAAVPLLAPDRNDHVRATDIRNACRRKGVQVGTIDALLAQLCIGHELPMLTTDRDFDSMAPHTSLSVWEPR